MVNQAIEKEINATAIATRSGISGRRLAKLALGLVAALAVATAVVPSVTRNTSEAAVSAQPGAAPSEGLVGAEYADATARIGVEAERWTALAAAYDAHILTPGRLAEMVRWDALVAAEYPGATAGARAGAERWTALAAAYDSHSNVTPGQLAEVARWEALADRYTRAQTAEAARWSGLANHHRTHSPALQAWADRYQGLADTSE